MNLSIDPPEPKAWFSFEPHFQVRFAAQKYPNAVARFFQRWLLGIYWMKA
jgi:hypothetical protein